jgi:hypothetical protein
LALARAHFVAPKALDIFGNNGNPKDAYPLGECQGDCDKDEEWEEGLICYHRDGGERVRAASMVIRTTTGHGQDGRGKTLFSC